MMPKQCYNAGRFKPAYKTYAKNRESKDDVLKIDEAVQDVPCNNILGLVIAGLSHAGCDESTGPSPWQKRDTNGYLSDLIARTSFSHFSFVC